jgi:hydrogenase maturation protease
MDFDRPAPSSVMVDGVAVARGSRVRLHPRASGDVFDLALADRVAIVEGIDQDFEDNLHVADTLEDDPGRDLGDARQPGHRFFFSLDEVEPLEDQPGNGMTGGGAGSRVLVGGIGNVFLGDDGFGVDVVARLAARELPAGVDVVDFGIRGMDLAYALGRGYDAAILVDASPRGEEPGTLSVIDVAGDEVGAAAIETHAMDPVRVLRMAASLGPIPPCVVVVACEPLTRMTGEEPDVVVELSAPVRAAVDEALELVVSLAETLVSTTDQPKEDMR